MTNIEIILMDKQTRDILVVGEWENIDHILPKSGLKIPRCGNGYGGKFLYAQLQEGVNLSELFPNATIIEDDYEEAYAAKGHSILWFACANENHTHVKKIQDILAGYRSD